MFAENEDRQALLEAMTEQERHNLNQEEPWLKEFARNFEDWENRVRNNKHR